MYEFHPYYTNDGSVGLYSVKNDDIYHSSYGALTEAYEKFILPANFEKFFEKNSDIKILDICFGIGYNSKSFLNYFYEYVCNAPRYTNNKTNNNCNYKIDTNNINSNIDPCTNKNIKNLKIYIRAIDTDEILAFLSPFIICNKKNMPKDYKLPFENEKILRLLNKAPKYKINFYNEINYIFYEKIIENHPEIFDNLQIPKILESQKYRQYFAPDICLLFKLNKKKRYLFTPIRPLYVFLHNIYYRHISNRYKKASKYLSKQVFDFDLKIEDARKELLTDNNIYNFIFLDAFTPSKCPCLWTLEFFKLLFAHLDSDGMILTYSNSASVRNAFLNAGFYVGKIYNENLNKYTGTIAVKNKSLIEYELSEYDLGLLKTKAGIFYRDENLRALNETILFTHKTEVEKSDLLSSSRYIKQYKKQTEEI